MYRAAWLLALLGCVFYGGSRLIQSDDKPLSIAMNIEPAPSLAQKVLAGPFVGIAADYNILSVFTLYDQIQNTLPDWQKKVAWQQLAAHLHRSSDLDPWFMDTYRLSSGLLAYSEYGTQDAVAILNKGTVARMWDWEIPFFAGFISYDALDDKKQAFYFFKIATERPGVPEMAIGLATRVLNQEQGIEASLTFLKYLIHTMPKQYHKGIQQRIQELKQQPSPSSEVTH